MGDFGAIVLVTFRAMDDGRHDVPMGRAIASQLVGDQPPRHATLPLQHFAEEAFGGFPSTARLDENLPARVQTPRLAFILRERPRWRGRAQSKFFPPPIQYP